MQVPIRELKSSLSHYLAQAQAGEVVEVTSHRKLVARIIGVPTSAASGLATLVASGAVQWNGKKPHFDVPLRLSAHAAPVSQMVMEDRG